MKRIPIFAALLLLLAPSIVRAAADIYPDPAQAKADVPRSAIRQAASEHKRVLVDFGGNWCPDCKILDIYFHDARNLPLLEKNFVLVHVNIGRMDANLDIAEKYGVPIKKGVPALAVLDAQGRVLYSQKQGEFEAMRTMQSSSVTAFLTEWRPRQAGCSKVMIDC